MSDLRFRIWAGSVLVVVVVIALAATFGIGGHTS